MPSVKSRQRDWSAVRRCERQRGSATDCAGSLSHKSPLRSCVEVWRLSWFLKSRVVQRSEAAFLAIDVGLAAQQCSPLAQCSKPARHAMGSLAQSRCPIMPMNTSASPAMRRGRTCGKACGAAIAPSWRHERVCKPSDEALQGMRKGLWRSEEISQVRRQGSGGSDEEVWALWVGPLAHRRIGVRHVDRPVGSAKRGFGARGSGP